ncbi:MAG: cobalamin synthesis protein P47K [Tannerella sp.]|nr:cobalamin synthesis protein P47K [Tannerella sp.]
MNATRLILTGGFLGAGKTTLLWKAAQRITEKGFRAGLITNDQAPELVDSVLLLHEGLKVAEVNGSCFCCNYNGFIDAAQHIRKETAADVIFAEPVGSCTDLSATIVQPLKKYGKVDFTVAPLTVLADPARLVSILDGGFAGLHEDAAYIYRKQLEESDIILITKADACPAGKADGLRQRTAALFPFATVLVVSALTGEGLDAWLAEVLQRKDAGKRLATVDYDIYAHGEAVLGWLNGTTLLHGNSTNWNLFVRELLDNLSDRFNRINCSTGHVKVIAENGAQYIAGNFTGNTETVSTRGSIDLCDEIRLTVNARVETSPEELDGIVSETLENLAKDKCTVRKLAWRCLSPGRPQPTHRFSEIIE